MSYGSNVHEGVSCDGCGFNNFGGNRYKCLRCYDFDLCHACYVGKRFPPGGTQHMDTHPMQMMLTQRDFEIIYEGDQTKNYDICKICSFTCPICNQGGLTVRTFGNHVNVHVYPLEDPVYCPLCIAYPGDSNRSLHDLKEHMTTTHSHLDNAPYRTEPIARAANRRPVLARRTQRQPAGQAGTFTQQLGINLPLNSMNWPSEDVEDMLRLANVAGTLGGRSVVPQNVASRIQRLQNNQGLNQLNQILNTGIHPNLPQIFGAPREPQTALQIQPRDQQEMNRAMNAISAAIARNPQVLNEARSNGVHAQPRHPNSQRLPSINQPIARLLRNNTIFPVHRFDEENMMSSSEAAELTGDEYGSGEEGLPPLEGDSSQDEDNIDTNASTSGISLQATRGDAAESQGNVETDSEFEFENPEDSNESSEANELEPVVNETEGLFPLERDILNGLSENTTPTEFSQLMRILQEDPESDYEPDEADDRTYADCIGDGDSLEEQLGKLVWSTIQFDVPSLHTFGILDTWNDQRFLRHRKLQRKMSCASTMEDTLKKADVVLSFLNVAAGKDDETKGSRPKVFDKPDSSVRRALKSVRFDEPIVDRLSNSRVVTMDPISNGQTNGHDVQEDDTVLEENPRTPTVKFQSAIEEEPRPEVPPRLYMYYRGEESSLQTAPVLPEQNDRSGLSSEDEETQDYEVDFIDDSEQ